jgi:hypothetical protein
VAGEAAEGFVVLASFDSSHLAERSVASTGKHFRAMSRKGGADALVVTANPDGSLKVRQSRALRARNFTNLFVRLSLSITIGFIGILSGLKGVKQSRGTLHDHQRHVGKDEHEVHAILASAGSGSALALVRCNDNELLNTVASATTTGAIYSWQGSQSEFLAALEPGSEHDWVRAAIGQTTST